MPDYRETIIRLDHSSKTAEIWTAENGLQNRLKRLGAKELDKAIRGQWYEVPIRWVRIGKPRGASGRPFAARSGLVAGSQQEGAAS